MMKISMMSYTMDRGQWGKTHDIKELCRFTQELGLDGIDWVTTYGIDPEEVRKIMDDNGLKTVCYTFFADINFPGRKDRQKGLDEIKMGIEIAHVLGTDKIMLPFGGKNEYSRREAKKNVIAGLKEAVRIGRKSGITVTVEDFTSLRSPFLVSSDFIETVKQIPELRVTYDSGNFFVGGEDPIVAYKNLKDMVVFGHFKDWTIVQSETGIKDINGRFYRTALVGEGIVDYKNLIDVIKESGYDGYMNLEYEGDDYSPEEAMRTGLKYLESMI
jgi:sugar phosphate isomerase/epimerase